MNSPNGSLPKSSGPMYPLVIGYPSRWPGTHRRATLCVGCMALAIRGSPVRTYDTCRLRVPTARADDEW